MCQCGRSAPFAVALIASMAGCAAPRSPDETPATARVEIAAGDQAAVAVVPQDGRRHWGFAVRSDRSSAEAAALRLCGSQRCRIVQNYQKPDCPVLVQGENQIFWGGTHRDDLSAVLDYCGLQDSGCQLVVHKCL